MHNFRHTFPRQSLPWRPNPGYRAPFPGRNPMHNNPVRWHQPQFFNKEERWCETCDRGFPSLDLLDKHKQQHQKCNIDGCQFVAHPKVITKHIQMQHSSGLYKKIAKLVNPEEIQKWREERKKKYPTKENIDKKLAETREKVDRGEKMGLNKDRRNRFNKIEPGMKRKFNSSYEHRQQQPPKPRRSNSTPVNKKPRNEPKLAPCSKENSQLPPFTGIQHIVMECDTEEKEENLNCQFVIDDDDCEVIIPDKLNASEDTVKPIICGALTSLLCDYGSSDDETNPMEVTSGSAEITKIHKTYKDKIDAAPPKPLNNVEIKLDQKEHESDNDSGPEEVKVIKNETVNTDDQNMVQDIGKEKDKQVMGKKKHIQTNQQKYIRRPKPKLPSTLLQKLLSKEVQHERNIVLQCIRYIKKNNYFEK